MNLPGHILEWEWLTVNGVFLGYLLMDYFKKVLYYFYEKYKIKKKFKKISYSFLFQTKYNYKISCNIRL